MPLRPPALTAAQEVLARLRDEVTDVRWARPETLHLTLHFFGAIDDGRMATALEAVEPAFAGVQPFEVIIDRLGSFPERGRPRVLWLGSSKVNPALLGLATRVHDRLRRAGFPVDERPFHVHATLGRPRDPWPRHARTAWAEACSRGMRPAAFVADRAALYESQTSRDAAVYVERAVVRFNGSG